MADIDSSGRDEKTRRMYRRMPWFYGVVAACLLITAIAGFSQAGTNRPLRYYTDDGSTAMTYYTNGSGNNTSFWGINTDNPRCEFDINGTICINGSSHLVQGVAINGTLISADGNNYPTALSVNQTGSSYSVVLGRNGLGSLMGNFSVSGTGGGIGYVNTTGANFNSTNWFIRMINDTTAQAAGVSCNAGDAISTLSNNSVCTSFITPAALSAFGYISSAPNVNVTGFTGSGTTVQLNLSNGSILNATVTGGSGTGNATADGTTNYVARFTNGTNIGSGGTWDNLSQWNSTYTTNILGTTTDSQVVLGEQRFIEASNINYLQSGAARASSSWQEWRIGPYQSSNWIYRIVTNQSHEFNNNVTLTNGSLFVLDTIYQGSTLTKVCLQNGTNCPAGGSGNVTATNGTAGFVGVFSSASNLVAMLINSTMIGDAAVNATHLYTSNGGSSGQVLTLNSTGGMNWSTPSTGSSSGGNASYIGDGVTRSVAMVYNSTAYNSTSSVNITSNGTIKITDAIFDNTVSFANQTQAQCAINYTIGLSQTQGRWTTPVDSMRNCLPNPVPNTILNTTTCNSSQSIPIPFDGYLRRAFIMVQTNGTLSSNQNTTYEVYVNGVATGLNGNITMVTRYNATNITNINQQVQFGDYVNIRATYPAWTTNPTQIDQKIGVEISKC